MKPVLWIERTNTLNQLHKLENMMPLGVKGVEVRLSAGQKCTLALRWISLDLEHYWGI